MISGQKLTDRLMEQIAAFSPVVHFGDLAKGLVKAPDDLWRITTDAGTTIEAPVIIAAGGGSFVPKKPLLENLDTYEGESVFYALRKTGAFRGKRVVIAGGGDSTLDWTLRLQPIAEQVMLLHHREGFRAAPHYYDYGKPKLWEAKRH